MPHAANTLDRRSFLHRSLGFAAATFAAPTLGFTAESPPRFHFCAFDKFLRTLSNDELADALASSGFSGVEATVRKGGRIEPERVEDELPPLVEALAKRNLQLSVMTTEINRADDPTSQKVLSTAAKLGVTRYRLGWFKYRDDRPIQDQLTEFARPVHELAALNRELGLTGLFQNHAGRQYVGATIWDLYSLIREIPVQEIAVAFDVRHATVEAGLSWPNLYRLIQPHIGALYMKDFDWSGRRDKHVPFGSGRVDPFFFESIRCDGFSGPISIHIEYLPRGSAQHNLEAIRRDFAAVKELLGVESKSDGE